MAVVTGYNVYKTSLVANDVSTGAPSTFDALECSLSNRNSSICRITSGDENIDYLALEADMITAATNKDQDSLYQILYPLIEAKDVERLDSIGALHWACYCGHPELVETFLQCGCDPHYPDDINLETPIYFAIRSSSVLVVQLLVQRFGTEVLCHENRKQMSPFLLAASEFVEDNVIATLHILEFLYLSGVSLEEQDSFGRTALMHASRRGCQFVVQWLLSKGANLAHRDHLGNTVLHHACHGGNEETLRFICKNGAIGLLDAISIATTTKEQSCLGICIMKRSFLQYTLLRIWSIQSKLTGRILTLRSPYPVYYFLLAIINLILFSRIYANMPNANPSETMIIDLWILNWFICQCFWFTTLMSDPGMVRKSAILSQSGRISSSFEDDCRKESKTVGGPYQAFLASLQQQQELINFEIYCINYDSFKSSIWFPHAEFSNDPLTESLNNYFENVEGCNSSLEERQILCKEEYALLQAKIRGIYPQVALERQSKCADGYLGAVMGTSRDLGIGAVCITCNMMRTPRSHHCGSCGVCMIRQDHHCAWVDNCIAKNNQRSFYIFILSVCTIICHTYYVLYLHFSRKDAGARFDIFWDACNIIFGIVGNSVWLAFVGYLLFRITRSTVTDVTFYEFLRKPDYVRKRFNGNVQVQWWDFSGLTVSKSLNNCLKFWAKRL